MLENGDFVVNSEPEVCGNCDCLFGTHVEQLKETRMSCSVRVLGCDTTLVEFQRVRNNVVRP